MKYLLSVLLTLVLSAIAFPSPVLACSCGVSDNIRTDFKQASVVVAAEVIGIATTQTETDRSSIPGRTVETQTVEWEVQESWKGKYQNKQKLITVTSVTCCLCGTRVVKGDIYILYLAGDAPFMVSMCSRSSPLKAALKDVPTLYKLAKKSRGRT